jgi:hypothetical protein
MARNRNDLEVRVILTNRCSKDANAGVSITETEKVDRKITAMSPP